MKKAVAFLLAAIALVSFAGCGGNQPTWYPAGMKLASTEDVDYTMFVPEYWTVDISTGVIHAYVSATDKTNVSITSHNLEGEDTKLTAETFWDKYEADLIKTFPDFTYFSISKSETETEATAESGEEISAEKPYSETKDRKDSPVKIVMDKTVEACKYYYTATVTGRSMKFMQVIAVRAQVVYILTYTSYDEYFDAHLEEVDNIIKNFSFNQK